MQKFSDALGRFRAVETDIQTKNRDLLVRRFQIVQPGIELAKIEAAVDAGPADMGGLPHLNVYSLAAGANMAELERKLEHLQAQRRSMMRLEKSIMVLNTLILDMHRMVQAQGEMLRNISSYTERTLEWQKATHIEQAVEYQKNIRKLRCGIL